MTRRRLALTLATLTLSLPAPAHARHPKAPPQPTISSGQALTPEDRDHLLNDTYTIAKTVREIPQPVQDVLLKPSASPLDRRLDGMADPGQEWQESDVLGSKPLPIRRLILAATSAGYSLIYDEHGGIAYHQLLTLYRMTGGSAKIVWSGGLDNSPALLNFDQIRAAFRDWKHHPPKRK